jgi:Tol biopolymer transport system component
VDLRIQQSETLLRMGDYERVIAEAKAEGQVVPRVAGILPANRGRDALDTKDRSPLEYHKFAALTALGEYDAATTLFREIIASGHEARQKFRDWCAKYVFDTLEAGRSWHPAEQKPVGATVSWASGPRFEGGTPSTPGTPSTQRGQDGRDTIGQSWHLAEQEPVGAAFLPMVEAEETYRSLVAKGGHRLTTDGFSARWSPDGKKLAFSLGVQGYSGVAVFDPVTKETDLLIVPGKDPRWSPDGKHIAFLRDRQNLRLEELARAEREKGQPPLSEEEIWFMKSDGKEPKRLARGGSPSWGSDSRHIYYLSRGNGALCSVSLAGKDSEPKQIMKCPTSLTLPSISPDNQRVAYLENGWLRIKHLDSQRLLGEQAAPFAGWVGSAWSPTSNELCVAGRNDPDDRTGLWIYSVDRADPVRVLSGQVTSAAWCQDGTRLAFSLGLPFFEIWGVNLDPGTLTADSLGPGQTLDEHFREITDFYTRRIEADPQDAYAYSNRARYQSHLGERAKANADMRWSSAILSGGLSLSSRLDTQRNRPRVVNLPFDCRLVFSSERPVNGVPMMVVAFGQKGRCEMKVFRVPMFVASLLGFCVVSGLDSPQAYADFTFGEPVRFWFEQTDTILCFSHDDLEMYISADLPGGYGGVDLYVRRRVSTNDDWGPRENLGPQVNTSSHESMASISGDGLTLCFNSWRPDGYGLWDIYWTERPTTHDSWGPALNAGSPINTAATDAIPWITQDGRELYFISFRPGGYGAADIYVTRRPTKDDPWGEVLNLGPTVNTSYSEQRISLSPDGLLLVFCDFTEPSNVPRPGGYGSGDIWMTRRVSLSAPWQEPTNLGPRVNSSECEVMPRILPDGRTLCFWNESAGLDYYWMAPIIPIVDFTGDGNVDGKDLLVMVMELGGSDSLCDIGPYAWGDGVVDGKDLMVLADYIGQGFQDPTLVAHWAFDETEGDIATDSMDESDGRVMIGATWRPHAGMVGGAVELDGVTGSVVTGSVAELGTGPFSVIAWVKGGAPGQIILSHNGMTDWLMANPIDGSLMTKLTSNGQPLAIGTSEAVITDGKWHRIALVWDGADRILYVDGKEVARDPQPDITVSDGKFIIGAGSKTGTGWSGLIDDVRIYNRVVRP